MAIVGIVWVIPAGENSRQVPRRRVIPSRFSSKALAEIPPTSTSTRGCTSTIWRSTKGWHKAISSAVGERLPGGADKRQALAVLFRAWRLTDHHKCGGFIAVTDDGIGCGTLESAAVESGDGGA